MWRLFLINCALCRAWKLHRMCCCAVSRKGGGWIWFGLLLLQKIEGTRMKHSRQIKGVSWGWSVEEVPPRVCCCNQCPALKSQWQCTRSHRNPIQGIYGAGTLTHMAIHAESNIRGGLRLQYICACTLHIATHQWAANKRMCAHAHVVKYFWECRVVVSERTSATLQEHNYAKNYKWSNVVGLWVAGRTAVFLQV